MIIGIDGNEANVKNRVGTGQYAFELLRQFAKISNYSSSGSEKNKLSYSSSESNLTRRVEKSKEESSRQARTIEFVVYLKKSPLPDLPKESASFRYKVFGPKKLWTQFALPIKLTFGQKIDVFFSMAHYGPRFSKIPYVVAIHDLSFLHYPELFKKSDLLQLRSWTKYSVQNATHIIAVSQTTKDDIVKNYNVTPSKITVTYEGYDEDRFKPQSRTRSDLVKKKYGVRGDYIIFVGTLQPRKNLERLIEAFASIVHSSQLMVNGEKKTVNREPLTDNLSLVIAGKKGWFYESIFEKVKELNLKDKIVFTEYVSDANLSALIGGASVYVLPSLWEGFGIPVIEAQACGVPVVVSNTSSLPEIVGATDHSSSSDRARLGSREASLTGRSGILVDPQNINSIAIGIKKVLTDEKLRSDLIKNGFSNVRRFSWQKCARQTLEILQKLPRQDSKREANFDIIF